MLEMVIDATIRSGTPIFLATTGTILMEKSGVINLGIEGLMLVGALTGFYTTFYYWKHLPWVFISRYCSSYRWFDTWLFYDIPESKPGCKWTCPYNVWHRHYSPLW